MAAETPGTVEERVRTSVALAEVRSDIEELKGYARASDAKLARLVDLMERRDRREEAAAQLDLEARRADLAERSARWSWLRSVASSAHVERALWALGGGAVGGGLLSWMGVQLPAPPASAPAPPVEAPAPPPPFDP